MRDAVQVYGGFPKTGTPGKYERNPRVYNTIIQTMTTAEANAVTSLDGYAPYFDMDAGGSTSQFYELNSRYDNANKVRRVLTQPFPYYEDGGRLEAGSQGQASTETNNVALNPFVIETIWDGFIIQNGRTRIRHGKDGGAGVALRKNGRLENCIIRNNYNVASRSRGGGAFCNNGTFSNCSFFNNDMPALGSDYGEQYGGGVYMRYGTLYNCVFAGNSVSGGNSNGQAVYIEVADFYNNTIADNSGSGAAIYCGYWFADGAANIYNTIIYNNSGSSQVQAHSNVVLRTSHCCYPSGSISGSLWR